MMIPHWNTLRNTIGVKVKELLPTGTRGEYRPCTLTLYILIRVRGRCCVGANGLVSYRTLASAALLFGLFGRRTPS